MKILQIHNEYKYFGGEDQIVEREKNLLLENNHEVIQLIRKNNEEIKNLYDQIIVSKNLTFSKKSEKIVDEKIQFNKPDIVHIHNFFPLWSPSILNSCIKNKIPVVMSIHNYRLVCANGALYRDGKICELCPKNGLQNAIFHRCYQGSLIKTLPVANLISNFKKNKIWNKINKLIVNTEFAKKKFVSFGIPQDKLTVKANFIEESYKTNDLNNNKGDFVIYIGRLSKEKGLETLIKAWEKIDFKLKIFGDGPLKEKIKNLIINNKKIELNDFIPNHEVSKQMSKAKFLIFPSEWYEGFSITLLEAFVNRLPVLSSNIGSMQEIIENNVNGMLFKSGDVSDLIEKINKMIENPDMLKTLKDKAYEKYQILYSKKKNYETLVSIYKEVRGDYSI
mgnify:FL=1